MDMETTTVADISTNVGATTINRTTAVTNRFYRPAAPVSLIENMDANGDQDEIQEELEIRQSRYDEAKLSKNEATTRLRKSEKDYKEFKDLSDRYMEADRVRVPDPEQTAVINTLQTSVSSIVLTGDAAAGTERQQTRNRMVKRLAELKDRQDSDRKRWDQACSDFDSCSTTLKSAKAKAGGGSQPIVDGRLLFCPFRGGSMARSSRDIIIEIWGYICGPQMLSMNFTRLLNSVRELRKALRAETRLNRPGNFNNC